MEFVATLWIHLILVDGCNAVNEEAILKSCGQKIVVFSVLKQLPETKCILANGRLHV